MKSNAAQTHKSFTRSSLHRAARQPQLTQTEARHSRRWHKSPLPLLKKIEEKLEWWVMTVKCVRLVIIFLHVSTYYPQQAICGLILYACEQWEVNKLHVSTLMHMQSPKQVFVRYTWKEQSKINVASGNLFRIWKGFTWRWITTPCSRWMFWSAPYQHEVRYGLWYETYHPTREGSHIIQSMTCMNRLRWYIKLHCCELKHVDTNFLHNTNKPNKLTEGSVSRRVLAVYKTSIKKKTY